ncbi:MAG: MazG-like family protein [Gammaproteobacteria bacterium]|nr:MazG-like family protein [Gammaproteobacteria bacterium]
MEELEQNVIQWAGDKGILTHSDPLHQMAKTFEEVNELYEAVLESDLEGIKDAIGDTIVTLIIQAEMQGLDGIQECVLSAYNEIKDRNGKMQNGLFKKEE